MVKKCCVVECHWNYAGSDLVPVFSFPGDEDMKRRWMLFVNRKDWQPTSFEVICTKHFEKKFFRKGESGKRFGLIKTLKPLPTIYPDAVSTSVKPTVTLPR